jgi:hypothetical protein
MWSQGFGADESKVAFIRARELAAAIDNPERFAIYYGLWNGNLAHGELAFAWELLRHFCARPNAAAAPAIS